MNDGLVVSAMRETQEEREKKVRKRVNVCQVVDEVQRGYRIRCEEAE